MSLALLIGALVCPTLTEGHVMDEYVSEKVPHEEVQPIIA